MKKIVTAVIIGVFGVGVLHAGVFCKTTMPSTGKFLSSQTYTAGVGLYYSNYLGQYPAIYGYAGDYKNNHTKLLIQGFCVNNAASAPIEFTDLSGPYTDDTGTSSLVLTCWCQLIYPFVSKVVYLKKYDKATTAYVESCMAECPAACKTDLFNVSSNIGYLFTPSETLYHQEAE